MAIERGLSDKAVCHPLLETASQIHLPCGRACPDWDAPGIWEHLYHLVPAQCWGTTQGLAHARRVLYHRAASPALVCLLCLEWWVSVGPVLLVSYLVSTIFCWLCWGCGVSFVRSRVEGDDAGLGVFSSTRSASCGVLGFLILAP